MTIESVEKAGFIIPLESFDLVLRKETIYEADRYRKEPSFNYDFGFCVENVCYLRSHASLRGKDAPLPHEYFVRDPPVMDAILNTKLEAFGTFAFLHLTSAFTSNGFDYSISLGRDQVEVEGTDGRREWEETGLIKISIESNPDLATWNRPFSFVDYSTAWENAYKASGGNAKVRGVLDDDYRAIILEIAITPINSATIGELIQNSIEEVKATESDALESLSNLLQESQVNALFNFPAEFRTPCEQYLLYFSDFLRDIGIRATSVVREDDAGQVLFSVTPIDGIQALERIREALSLFLKLPSSPVADADYSLEGTRLLNEVESLRNRLRMKALENRMLERENQQLNFWLDQKSEYGAWVQTNPRESIVKLLPESTTDVKKALRLTKVKKAEDYGVELNLDVVFDRLRNWFKGKKE